MKNQSTKTSDLLDNIKRRRVIKASLGFVFGAILGLIIGNMVGSPALGLIFGAGIGLIVGSALDHRRK
jgi:uncharacterized protein YqgC (DUF456 family)